MGREDYIAGDKRREGRSVGADASQMTGAGT